MHDLILDILLVEDRAEDAELALMALRDNNLANSIKWVRNGQEALDYIFAEENDEVIRRRRPRIVLLDLKMPKVNGIEVLRKIRSHPSTKTLPVIIMTTSTEEKDKIEAYNLGVNSYVLKPVGFENFTKSVREIGLYWLLLNEQPE